MPKPALKERTLRLCDAKTLDEVCALPQDNMDADGFWFLADGYNVAIAEQAVHESPRQMIKIPRETFNKFVCMYMQEHNVKLRK